MAIRGPRLSRCELSVPKRRVQESKEPVAGLSEWRGRPTALTRITCAILVFVLLIMAGWAWGDIKGSKHDFSDKAWAPENACSICHPPSPEQLPVAAPLWDPDADLSKRFGTADGGAEGPGLGTRVCLQCHDGTIINEAVTSTVGERCVNKENRDMFDIGHDATDHPVGVEYPQSDKRFRPVTSVVAGGTVTLPDGKVECISCHDPHNASGVESMLVTGNARGGLCLTCHRR